MIKLIALDLDGTLVPSDQVIPERTARVIREVVEQGVYVVLASGRCTKSAAKVQQTLGISGQPLILHNGVIVRVDETRPTILDTIPLPTLQRFYRCSMEYDWDCSFVFGDCDMVYTNTDDEFNHFVMREYNLSEPVYTPDFGEMERYCRMFEEPNKILVTCDNLEQTLATEQQLRREFGDGLSVLVAGERFIDIAPSGVSKGVGLRELTAKLGISPEEVMAVGDSNNDLTMLAFAGVSVAMENALETVKQAARYRTDSNDREGVRKAIEKYVLGESHDAGYKLRCEV